MADPLQLNLKIAIFLNFVREIPSPETTTKITLMCWACATMVVRGGHLSKKKVFSLA